MADNDIYKIHLLGISYFRNFPSFLSRISLNKKTSYNNRQTQFKPMVQFISKINRNVGNFGRNFV